MRQLTRLFLMIPLLITSCDQSESDKLEVAYDELKLKFNNWQFEDAYLLSDSIILQAIESNNRKVELRTKAIKAFAAYRYSIVASNIVPLLEEVLEEPEHIDPFYEPHIYLYLAATYVASKDHRFQHKQEHFKVSDSLLNRSMNMYQDRGDEEGVVNTLWEIANMYWYDDRIDISTTYYEKAYNKALEIDYVRLPIIIQNLASVYIIARRWDESITLIESIFDQVESEAMEAFIYCTLQEAYQGKEDWSNSIKYAKSIIDVVQTDRAKKVRAWVYEPLIYSYIKQEKYDSAKYWLKKGEEYTLEKNEERAFRYLDFARAYIASNEGDEKKAVSYASSYLQSVMDDGSQRHKLYHAELQYQMNKDLGMYQQALADLEDLKVMEDSILRSSYIKNFENYRVRLETAEQRVNILNLEKEVQNRNIRITLISAALILTVFAGLYIIKNYKAQKRRAQEQLVVKEKKLSDFTLSLLKKNQVLEELDHMLKESSKRKNGELIESVNRMKVLLSINRNQEGNWDQFVEYFGSVHKDFFDSLKKKYPNLSAKDLRHCALVKMNLSTKEAAEILGVEVSSVKMARYRLRKKIGIDEDQNLHTLLVGFG